MDERDAEKEEETIRDQEVKAVEDKRAQAQAQAEASEYLSRQQLKAKLIEETRWLMELPEQERREYVREVIQGLGNSIKDIRTSGDTFGERLQQASALITELNVKAPTLIPPITYAVKPEYQDVFRDFLQSIMIG